MELNEDLQRLTSEIDELEGQRLRLTAKIRGLRAERDALSEALRAQSPGPRLVDGDNGIRQMVKNDAIVAVLRASDSPMRIGEIVSALNATGRDENYAAISVYLQSLLERGLVDRVARGLYRAA